MKKLLLILLFISSLYPANAARKDGPVYGVDFLNFSNAGYENRTMAFVGVQHIEMDSTGILSERSSALNIGGRYWQGIHNDYLTQFSACVVNFTHYFTSVTYINFISLEHNMRGLAENYGKFLSGGLGIDTHIDPGNIFIFSLEGNIAYANIKPGENLYSDLDIYKNVEIEGADFSINSKIGFSTGLIDVYAKNELQAIFGNEAIGFYRLSGNFELDLGSLLSTASDTHMLYVSYFYERTFIEDYIQVNNVLSAGLRFWFP